MPREFILSPEVAMQSCAFWTFIGFWLGNAAWKEVEVINVAEAPVSNSYENVLTPTLAVTLGLTLSPLNGVIWLKMLLHIAIDTVHKFKINCGMTLGAFMRGVMKLLIEKPNQPHYWNHC